MLEPEQGLTIYFLDQPEFYQRAGLYQKDGVDYPDNAERFIFLAKAVAHLALNLDWKPDVVHLNDWQVGFAALLLHDHSRVAPMEPRPAVDAAYTTILPCCACVRVSPSGSR